MLGMLPFLKEHFTAETLPFFRLLDANLIFIFRCSKCATAEDRLHRLRCPSFARWYVKIDPGIDATLEGTRIPRLTAETTRLIEP